MTENYMFVTAPGAEVSVAPIDSETKAPSPVLTFLEVSTDDRGGKARRPQIQTKTPREQDRQTDRNASSMVCLTAISALVVVC